MRIEKNKVVALSYDLEVEGSVVDSATPEQPLDYIHGTHMLLPRFEAEIEGLDEGAAFSFTVQPEEGYGAYDERRRLDLPKSAFVVNGELREELMQVGRILPMINAAGNVVNATVVEVKEDGVTMDFNHPMAGKVLHFKGQILSVRDATDKELAEGLHGEYLPQDSDPHGHCCHHGKGHCHHHDHEDGGCCHHGEGECHGHHDHEDGECCGHHGHGDGECCGHGHCHNEEN